MPPAPRTRIFMMTETPSETFDVAQVLRPTSRPLVADECVAADEIDDGLSERVLDSVGPSFRERDSGQVGEDVDSPRRYTDLIRHTRYREIGLADVLHRRAERCQCTHDTGRVRRAGLDPDVEISGGSRPPMDRERIGTDDEKTYVSGDERA